MEEDINTQENENLEQNTENSNPTMKYENEPKNEYEKKIQDLEKELETTKQDLEEKDDRVKRLMAEFENFKKRSDKEREGMFGSVMGDVVMKLLPVVDNLEKAVSTETTDENYKNGVEMVLNQFKEVLKQNNVVEIEAVGQKFDPSLHEAVMSVQDESLGEKVVKEEFKKGYMIGDRVLRHSLVVVAN